jgi:hypothetical protein
MSTGGDYVQVGIDVNGYYYLRISKTNTGGELWGNGRCIMFDQR